MPEGDPRVGQDLDVTESARPLRLQQHIVAPPARFSCEAHDVQCQHQAVLIGLPVSGVEAVDELVTQAHPIPLVREPVAAAGIEGRHRAYRSLDGLPEGAPAANQTAEHSQRVDLHALSRKQPEILDAGCPRRLLHEPERLAEGDQGLGIVGDDGGEIRAREKPFRGRADAFEDGDDRCQPGCPNERDGGESGKR